MQIPAAGILLACLALQIFFCFFLLLNLYLTKASLPPTMEEVNAIARDVCLSVCLAVCLLARLLKNAWMDFAEMLRADVGTWRNWLTFEPDPDHIVRMPEPDYFLRYCMHCNARNFITSGKSHVQVLSMVIRRPCQQRRVVLRCRKTVVGGKCALPSALLYSLFV